MGLNEYAPMYVSVKDLESRISNEKERHLIIGNAVVNAAVERYYLEAGEYLHGDASYSKFLEMKLVKEFISELSEKGADYQPSEYTSMNKKVQAIDEVKRRKNVRLLGRISRIVQDRDGKTTHLNNSTILKIGESFERAIKSGEELHNDTYAHLRRFGRQKEILKMEYELVLAQLGGLGK